MTRKQGREEEKKIKNKRVRVEPRLVHAIASRRGLEIRHEIGEVRWKLRFPRLLFRKETKRRRKILLDFLVWRRADGRLVGAKTWERVITSSALPLFKVRVRTQLN